MTTGSLASTDQHRRCGYCDRPITVQAANPRKRYCSPRCRVADWHRRNDRPLAGPSEPGAVPEQAYAANAVPTAVPDHETASSCRCPHCGQPVTAITLLVPPAAAQVTIPTTGQTRHG